MSVASELLLSTDRYIVLTEWIFLEGTFTFFARAGQKLIGQLMSQIHSQWVFFLKKEKKNAT